MDILIEAAYEFVIGPLEFELLKRNLVYCPTDWRLYDPRLYTRVKIDLLQYYLGLIRVHTSHQARKMYAPPGGESFQALISVINALDHYPRFSAWGPFLAIATEEKGTSSI